MEKLTGKVTSNSIEEMVRKIAVRTAAKLGVEFVHSEIAGTKRDSVVRIFIDKPGGITLDDCSEFSGETEAILDADDLIPGKYVLEISSPGIERELYNLDDMVRFTGALVKVKARLGLNGQKTFVGTLDSVNDEDVTITDRTSGTVTLPYSDVVKANLKMDLSEELKKR